MLKMEPLYNRHHVFFIQRVFNEEIPLYIAIKAVQLAQSYWS